VVQELTTGSRAHSYATNNKFDPLNIWVDFLEGSDLARAHCKIFLRLYLQKSIRQRVTLGAEEVITKRTINSAATLEDIWEALVNVADQKVMAPKRVIDRKNASFWSLTYSSQVKSSLDKPAYQIARVSEREAEGRKELPSEAN
jgi:hypothetical protein